jgi:hypothetical protein
VIYEEFPGNMLKRIKAIAVQKIVKDIFAAIKSRDIIEIYINLGNIKHENLILLSSLSVLRVSGVSMSSTSIYSLI